MSRQKCTVSQFGETVDMNADCEVSCGPGDDWTGKLYASDPSLIEISDHYRLELPDGRSGRFRIASIQIFTHHQLMIGVTPLRDDWQEVVPCSRYGTGECRRRATFATISDTGEAYYCEDHWHTASRDHRTQALQLREVPPDILKRAPCVCEDELKD